MRDLKEEEKVFDIFFSFVLLMSLSQRSSQVVSHNL